PRVVIPLPVFPELLLHIRGRLVDRRKNRARCGIGLLPDVNRICRKAHVVPLVARCTRATRTRPFPVRCHWSDFKARFTARAPAERSPYKVQEPSIPVNWTARKLSNRRPLFCF